MFGKIGMPVGQMALLSVVVTINFGYELSPMFGVNNTL